MARPAQAGWFRWIPAILRRFASEFDADSAVELEYLRIILEIDGLHKWLTIRLLQMF
jgi:hypothetical protein